MNISRANKIKHKLELGLSIFPLWTQKKNNNNNNVEHKARR